MGLVQIAIPMLRGKRRFHIEKGRRWSVIEHLMLDTVAKEPSSATRLSELSELPPRIVVEAFIRLMRVGWVEIFSQNQETIFRATPTGLTQVRSGFLSAPITMQGRWMSFAWDRLTGSVFRGREVQVRPIGQIEKATESEALVFLEPSFRYSAEDLADIFNVLEGRDEVIVGTDPSPGKLFEGYAVVSVLDGAIEGLPPRASESLRSIIVSKAALASKNSGASSSGKVQTAIVDDSTSTKFTFANALFDHTDLLLDDVAHRGALQSALEQSREQVVIHSTFITSEAIDVVMPMLIGAAVRGVKVQILWGQSDDKNDDSSSRRAAMELLTAVQEAGRSEQIVVHPFTTGSHAKILFSDDGAGGWTAVVGSCNWLASQFDSFEASIKVRDPALVGEIVRHLGALSMGVDAIWQKMTTDLTVLGRRISSLPRGTGRTAPLRIILAPDHSTVALEARDEARKRILVTSHRIGIAGQPMVILPTLAAANANGIDAKLFYGRPTGVLSGIDAAQLAVDFARQGVNIRPVHKPRLHAKVLAWDDDSLVVTSQNWLSADPSTHSIRREIGVQVRMNKIADTFIRRFDHAQAAQSHTTDGSNSKRRKRRRGTR